MKPRVHGLAHEFGVDPRPGLEIPHELFPEVEFDGAPADGKGDRPRLRRHAPLACERQPRSQERKERDSRFPLFSLYRISTICV
jgi:hypothetical protein